MAAPDGAHIAVLQQELERLQNATAHLADSNSQLKAAIEEEGDDEDRTYKTAIEENIVTIAKYRAQAERLERELRELRGAGGPRQLGGAQAVPADADMADAGPQQPAAAAAPAAAGSQPAQQQPEGEQQGGMWM